MKKALSQSIYAKIEKLERKYDFVSLFYEDDNKPYTKSYRRELNNQCNDCDYVIWGESDCLMPRQIFGMKTQTLCKRGWNQQIHGTTLENVGR